MIISLICHLIPAVHFLGIYQRTVKVKWFIRGPLFKEQEKKRMQKMFLFGLFGGDLFDQDQDEWFDV